MRAVITSTFRYRGTATEEVPGGVTDALSRNPSKPMQGESVRSPEQIRPGIGGVFGKQATTRSQCWIGISNWPGGLELMVTGDVTIQATLSNHDARPWTGPLTAHL